ncbi:MAG: 8-oxo-dGTP diphosphatase [Variibacter sp.]|nr:8-oxo-dGTP diphosphatase [Variibacter sp.]
MTASDPRAYPDRPFVAVSAAIFRNGRVLLVRRAKPPSNDLFTLPGGVVEVGETLEEALRREVAEETRLVIAPVGLVGHREFIERDPDARTARHFIILAFAVRFVSGDVVLNEELAESRWVAPAEVPELRTTEALAEIVARAAEMVCD